MLSYMYILLINNHDNKELIAPSMWKNNLNLHTQSILPVPEDWLSPGKKMSALTAITWLPLHISNLIMENAHQNLQLIKVGHSMLMPQPSYLLCAYFIAVPSDTCLLNPCQHLQVFYWPHSIQISPKNREEAWLKFLCFRNVFFCLPNGGGRHQKSLPINHLCDLWSKDQFVGACISASDI